MTDIFNGGLQRRARRALERQLDYQRKKAAKIKGRELELIAGITAHAQIIRHRLEQVRPFSADTRVLEVGCGAHGLIFFFGAKDGIGIDPLADNYAKLFPMWQGRARTIVATGENLPFANGSFDIVLCDNVVDHAENPRRIVEEIARILVPGGLLYFEVNVHHLVYHIAASIHAGWRALGIPLEVTPFADHTVHLTIGAARHLFTGLPLRIITETDNISEVKKSSQKGPSPHIGDQLKRFFFKNAQYEIIAMRALA